MGQYMRTRTHPFHLWLSPWFEFALKYLGQERAQGFADLRVTRRVVVDIDFHAGVGSIACATEDDQGFFVCCLDRTWEPVF